MDHAHIAIAVVTVVGTVLGAVIGFFGNRNQKIIDVIALRLEVAEKRLDSLEKELVEERHSRVLASVYAEALHSWSRRAYRFIVRNDLEFDPPPVRQDVVVRACREQHEDPPEEAEGPEESAL